MSGLRIRAVEPVLAKAIVKKGNSYSLKLGDKDVPWSFDFKLYLTTKLNNPHYPLAP